jgi:hypothetical protein
VPELELIGERLLLAEKTVTNYVSGQFDKLCMERRRQAAAYATRIFGDQWRVFGRARVHGEIGRIRSVLAGWGYRLGLDDDQLLLNRSPHLEDLSTGLFERREHLLPAARGNTLHAMQRAVAELGFCDPPQRLTGRHSVRASGGPLAWGAQVERLHGTSAHSPRVRDSVRATR